MKTLSLGNERRTPSDAEIRLARESAAVFEGSVAESFTIVIDGRKVEVPGSLSGLLGETLRMIAEGQSVAVVAAEKEIGTQEAAELLGVSRPFLVKLLDRGEIPSRKVGVQRRVFAADIANYKANERAARRKVLEQLAAEDQRLHLGE